MGVLRGSNPGSDDHIDPRNGVLVCGGDGDDNMFPISHSLNSAKSNRFVPYRIHTLPAPRKFGDLCEFLINSEWVKCEFGGKMWWEESNRIGNGSVDGGKSQGGVNVYTGHWEDIRPLTVYSVSKQVLVTDLSTGHVYHFPTRSLACEKFGLHMTLFRDLVEGRRKTYKGYTAVPFYD
jgi:hypothetical protein